MKNTRPRTIPGKKKMKIDSFTVEKKDTLLACLLTSLPHKSRNVLKAVLRDGQVTVDGTSVSQFDHGLRPGQRIEVRWDKKTPQQQPHGLNIVYEDQELIIINKPAGLLTIATDKEKRKTAYAVLSNYVKQEDPENKIFVIHRLDRETSGLLMFAKNETIKTQIQENWATTIEQRTYIGVVEGEVQQQEGTILSWLKESKAFIVYSSQNPKHGQKAVTHYKKIKGNNSFSLLQINLETGRKHQIRVHMQDIQHPIIGDSKYGSTQSPIRRMGLHAQVLAFTHPKTGKLCRFETEIPRKFLQLFSPKTK
ncbi:MAG: RluA family pseudouridine synthase [Desulfobulbaceae bacterium]|nr:RluA family pseudouridine synthase [Desulfobulbaceae bacterium]